MARQLRRLGLGHDDRRAIRTIDPDYYRWTQWIFLQIFNAWYDEDAVRPDGGRGRARPIAELVEAFAAAGVADRARLERPITPEAIDALLDVWPIFEAFQLTYVSKGLLLEQEKNASALSPNGPSAGASATAKPASKPARTARRG